MLSAVWVPTGDSVATDVRAGKTFFNTTRSLVTGTLIAGAPCSTQAYHDNHASATQGNNCSINWLTADPIITGDDKLDPRTSLVWSQVLRNNAGIVEFTASTGSTWSWDASAANNIAVGNKTALQLCSERGNGWRLPTQKEFFQAYIDGSYWNLSQPSNYFHTSTEQTNTATPPNPRKWAVDLYDGSQTWTAVTTVYSLRCVR